MTSDNWHNAWIMSIDQEDPITAGGVIDTLNYLSKHGKQEVVLQLHKRTDHNGTLLNECRSFFDKFERSRPYIVVNNGSHSTERATQPQPVPSRTRNNVLLSQYHDVVHPECNYVVDSAIPVKKRIISQTR